MKTKLTGLLVLTIAVTLATASTLKSQSASQPSNSQKHEGCPMMDQRQSKGPASQNKNQGGEMAANQTNEMAEMNRRGDHAMGFSQASTTHHFRLLTDGGAIEVEANDASDTKTREQIRQHLSHIARAFSIGDFDIPFVVHDKTPAGVPVMKQLKTEISYSFEETEKGGRVRIRTSNREALAAIHDFLRFQIKEHQTGDSMEKQK